ncbi:MAG: choice-of-anchor B family protein [Candidatus Marinimicrobia bacterium]|nr:choice-of-anchor B family protein [Candidatus Neomarinimicrobiota bacterium]
MRKFALLFTLALVFPQGYNMELVSFMDFGQNTSDITGFYQDGREFAVVGLQNAAAFVDITDPSNPVELGRISGGNSIWRDLKYWNRHVYIGTEASDGVKVVSVDNPDTPVLVHTITDFSNSHNIHIDADGYLYVVGASSNDVWIYELGDTPASPQLVGTWNGEYLHDIEVYNNKLYGAGIYSGIFYIVDVSDKTNPVTLASHNTGGGYISTHDCAVTEDERYLFTGDENTGGHVKVWDIQDYGNINLVAEYMTNPSHSAHNLYVRPGTNLLIISYYADGTRILDISDPTNPLEVAYYDTSDIEGLYVGNWGVYAYLPSGYLISSDIETGMYVLMTPLIVSPPEMEYSVGNTTFELASGESSSGSINITNTGDVDSELNYTLSTTPFSTTGGSDSFGNIYSDSNMNEDLDYDWVDISGSGTQYSFPHNDQAGSSLNLDFDFPFYGESHSSLIINANGWIGFGEDNTAWDNTAIPSASAPSSAIFGFWDDLNPVNDNCNQYCSGNVYYHGNTDRFVVWFNEVAHWYTNFEDSYYDFQIVLYPSGDIEINYNTLTGIHDATVGIQNSNGSDGIQMANGSNAASNGLSRAVTSAPDWIDLGSNNSGQLAFNESASHQFTVDSEGLAEGSYSAFVKITSNGGSASFPVDLTVGEGSDIMPGDVNFDNTLNVLDVVILTNFILETDIPSPDQFTAADINADGILNVLDIVNLVNLILD